jgi:hypothetical protein
MQTETNQLPGFSFLVPDNRGGSFLPDNQPALRQAANRKTYPGIENGNNSLTLLNAL